MTDTAPVRRWAATLRVLTWVAMAILATALLAGIAFLDLPEALRRAAGIAPDHRLDPLHRAGVAALGALPSLAMLYGLHQMALLLGRYAGGETLTQACARHIQRIGAALLVAVALELVSRPLQIMLASLANPPGERVLALSLEGADLGQVLAGGLMVMIGWAMHEAAEMAEENRGFI
ncbi:DUF2975 domain-containing protein [Pararhodobacter sp.]|uniref:DUF2975 domain-containing protein n=1 Tax=Pararhodobacter sp. TaxID=2127056 RepID=UPI002FE32B47|nr:DUF2975 domain-containing protein [Pseudomonadota bacterium]